MSAPALLQEGRGEFLITECGILKRGVTEKKNYGESGACSCEATKVVAKRCVYDSYHIHIILIVIVIAIVIVIVIVIVIIVIMA